MALAAHPGLYPMLGQEWSIAVGPLLAATVRMHEQPRRGLALAECHGYRLMHPLRPPMMSHRPPEHGPRAQSQNDSKIPPTCSGREGGHLPHRDGIGFLHCQLPVKLMWGHRLGWPCGGRRFAPAARFAAQAGLGQPAPKATAADLYPLWSSQVFDPARPVRAPPLGTRVLYFDLHGLLSFHLGARRATPPLVLPTPRDLQELTQAADLALGVRLVYPRVRYGRWCAKDAVAFFKMARSSCKRAFSFRRRFSAS